MLLVSERRLHSGISYKKGSILHMRIEPFLSFCRRQMLFCGSNDTLFPNAGSLACEPAQIVKLSTAHLTTLVHLDAVDSR